MMEGLKEALQYITGLKEKSMEPKLVEIEGRTYCTDNGLTRYHRFPMASDIEVNTLTALVDAEYGIYEQNINKIENEKMEIVFKNVKSINVFRFISLS